MTVEPRQAGEATGAGPSGPPRSIRLLVLAGAVVAVVAIAVARSIVFGGPSRHVESGIVVAVQATSLSDVQGFSIRTGDGRTLDFRIGALETGATFPIGHLSDHKVSLEIVRVTFIDRDGAHVAIRIEDGP